MNLRKWVIYICCVFAGLILLAHAFIPHVHCYGTICFVQGDICNATGCEHEDDHQHSPLDSCRLNEVQIRLEANESLNPDLSDQFLLTYHLILFPTESLSVKEEINNKWQYNPCLLFYTSVSIDSTYGLRAPPAPLSA